VDLAACRQGNREWQCPRESRAEQLVDCSTASKEWTDQEGTNMYKQHHYAWQSLGSSFKQSEAIRSNPTTADIPRARWNLHSFGPARHMLLLELRQNRFISFVVADETAVP